MKHHNVCFLFFLIHFSVSAQVKTEARGKASVEQDSLNKMIIHQEISFTASPMEVYQTLLSSKKFSACIGEAFSDFTPHSAKIDSAVGGVFSVFDGHIIGRILELIPGERIVEAWRVVDWPAGKYSIAEFEFKPDGSGTHLTFNHTGFPEGKKKSLASGWQNHYWNALTKYFQH